MPHTAHALLGAIVLVLALGLRALTVNRYVRRRLSLTVALAVAYVLANAALPWIAVEPALDLRIRSWEQLVLALAILNAIVISVVNPLGQDRLPERFPGILQDTILVVAYVLVATFVFRETLATTSAVGAVVVGFALQDTLGNAFAGLALQMEKPFRVGHWITVGGFEGRVAEVTWRATKLRTKTGNFVVLPNNFIAKEAITNYSEPAAPTRLHVDVGIAYDSAPNAVKPVLLEAVRNCRRALAEPEPYVLLTDFAASSVTYRVWFWVSDFERDDEAREEVRTAIYYALGRHGVEIPYPIQVEYSRVPPTVDVAERLLERARLLKQIDLLAPLSDQERERLAAFARERLYGDGEAIVRQGQEGASLYVISSGRAVVTVDPGGEVATIEAGGYVGEMSMLTGEPRSATVSARGDCRVFEISAEMFREIAASNPSVLEQVGAAAMSRRTELHAVRDAAARPTPETSRSLLLRMKRFLRL
jgi:small-conductance mechanosensitive channel/CRP-like cAMP-binding protein